MKIFITLIILSSMSFSLMASDKIEAAKDTVTKALANPFMIRNYNAAKEAVTIIVSSDIVDLNSLECEEKNSVETMCAAELTDDARAKYKVDVLAFVVNDNSKLITNIFAYPLDAKN